MATGYTSGDPGKVPTARTITAGTGLSGGGDLSTNRSLSVVFGLTPGTAAAGDGFAAHTVGTTGVHGIADTAALALKGSLVFDVKDFGAVGDGVTDDSAAIQAAISAASAAASSAEFASAGRGIVYLPTGSYAVTNLLMKSNVNIIGAGYRTTALIATADTGYVLDVSGLSNAVRMANVSIQGITIGPTSIASGGLAADRPTCGGINLSYSQWCSLRDVFIHNLAGTGVNLTSTFDLVTHGVHLLHTGTDYTTPALLMTGTATDDGTNATHHFGMRIERCPVMIYCANAGRRPFNNQFVGCKFEWHATGQAANVGPGIWIEHAEQITFGACHFVCGDSTYPMIRGGAASGTQTCVGAKFVGCDWIAPTSGVGWAFDATALCVDPEFVGCHASRLGRGFTGVSGCIATFSAVTTYSCAAPVIDMVGPTIVGSRFLLTSTTAANVNILRVSSRARVIGCHIQGVLSGQRPDGISFGNDTIIHNNLFDQLVVGTFASGTNANLRANVMVNVFTPYSGAAGWQAANAVQVTLRPTVTGSRASGAALTSLLTALSDLGLVIDNTSA